MTIHGPPREMDRVRRHTSERLNARIDHELATRLEDYADRPHVDIADRLDALEREWSLDRVLFATTSASGLLGVGLGAAGLRRAGLAIAGLASAAALQFVALRWCPLVSVLRRLGLRTRREIDCEKFALKAVRGDFDAVCNAKTALARAGNALQAVPR